MKDDFTSKGVFETQRLDVVELMQRFISHAQSPRYGQTPGREHAWEAVKYLKAILQELGVPVK